MRHSDPGRPAGRAAGSAAGPPDSLLAGGAGDQLAALVARAANAPTGMIHFVQGDHLRLYGGFGLLIDRADVADTPIKGTLAELVMDSVAPVIVGDITDDARVTPESPVLAWVPSGAYLGHPVCDHHGDVVGVCSAFDITPRDWSAEQIAAVAEAAQVSMLLINEKIARYEVDRQRRFLDAVVDSLHEGVTACDADGRIMLANARMRQLWGDAPVPATLDDDAALDGLLDWAGNPLRREDVPLSRALRGERLRDQELVLRGRARRTRYYLVDAKPILGPDGESLGAVQAVSDVTRRRRAERFRTCELAVVSALAEAPSVAAAGPRVLAAVGSTLDWAHAELWLVDETARVVRPAATWSAPGWQAELEVPDQLPYGRGLAGRAWQVDKPLWIRDVGQPQSLISRRAAATSRLGTALAIPVRHGTESLGVLTVFADTVEDPEDEIVVLLAGIAAHLGQFVDRRLVDDLQRQLVRSKNEYLSLIGHELRTPLTSISAYTELLRELDSAALAADGPALLEVIDRNTAALRNIIDELLELSALDTGHAAVSTGPVDLAEVVRESVERTRAAIDGAPLVLTAELPERLVLPGDRRRLRQIIDNLLGNAVKYSPDGGHITVRLRALDRAAELVVSDTGIGVSPEEREKLFTRLYRSSKVRDRAIPGTGLGLAMSRAVVQRHHGTIELAEHQGKGTTVLVRLPLDRR